MLLAKQFDAGIAPGNVAHDPGAQLDSIERQSIIPHGDLVLTALVAKIEQGLGETAFRHATKVFDVECLARQISHGGLR